MSQRVKFELCCLVIALLTLKLPTFISVLGLSQSDILTYSILAAAVIYYGLVRFLTYLKDNDYFEK